MGPISCISCFDIAGMPASVSAWTGRLRHDRYEVEDTASLRFEYPGRLVHHVLHVGRRTRENRIRFVGDAGAIEWTGGEAASGARRRGRALDYSRSSRRRHITAGSRACSRDSWRRSTAVTQALRRDPSSRTSRRVASVVEHAYVAARNGTTVAIPDDA